MKKILIILSISLLFSGCVANKKGPLGLEPENISSCPDLIKEAANNLEQIGVDHARVQKWKKNALEMNQPPCSVSRKISEVIFVLKDESGDYKDAMKKMIQAIEKYDPNAAPPTNKQEKEIGNDLMDNNVTGTYSLANKYISALDDLQIFMMGELHMSPSEARNFVLDKYFIPLLKQDGQAKQSQ